MVSWHEQEIFPQLYKSIQQETMRSENDEVLLAVDPDEREINQIYL